MLKARGVKAGWPDITIYWELGVDRNGAWCQCPAVGHIELKSHKGRMTSEQLEFARRAESLGHHHAVIKGIDQLRETLVEWGVPSRESNDNQRSAA